MINQRQSIIQEDLSIVPSGTWIKDLSGEDPISRLTILPIITNPNAWVNSAHPDEAITKIELVDSSQVIFSMDAAAARGLAYVGTGHFPVTSLNYSALQWAMCPIEIYFGRDLWDPEYALDPAWFKNLQLRITHDLDAYMAGATVGYLNVYADVFNKGAVSPKGYLLAQDTWDKTCVSAAKEYIDLPTDFPVRLVMLKNLSDTQAPEYQVDRVKLTVAHDKTIIFNILMERYQQLMQSLLPPYTEKVSGRMAATDVYFWMTAAFEPTIVFAGTSDSDGVLQMSAATGGQKRKCEASAVTEFEAIARGHSPNGCVPLFLGDKNNPSDAIDFKSEGGGQVELTFATNASIDTNDTYHIITQQYRSA